MEAKIRNKDGVSIVTIQGILEIENTQPFRDVCLKHLMNKHVIFNMAEASFVGSTGLNAFFETVKTLSQNCPNGLKVVGVSPEFRRVFQNMELSHLQLHENEHQAMQSFAVPHTP